MFIEVRNINGTSDNLPPKGYTSWFDYWEKNVNSNAYFVLCSNIHCGNLAEVGGHVKLANVYNNRWFIVPLCKGCNNKSSNDTYFVNDNNLCPVR